MAREFLRVLLLLASCVAGAPEVSYFVDIWLEQGSHATVAAMLRHSDELDESLLGILRMSHVAALMVDAGQYEPDSILLSLQSAPHDTVGTPPHQPAVLPQTCRHVSACWSGRGFLWRPAGCRRARRTGADARGDVGSNGGRRVLTASGDAGGVGCSDWLFAATAARKGVPRAGQCYV